MANTKPHASQIRYTPSGGSEQNLDTTLDAFPAGQVSVTRTSGDTETVAAVAAKLNSSRKVPDFDIIMDSKKLVITGDSLSYNRYDFDPVGRTNAYDCYPGMKSWSFMIRDLRASKNLQYGDVANYFPRVQGSNFYMGSVNGGSSYLLPFNGRYTSLFGSDNTEWEFQFYADEGTDLYNSAGSTKWYLQAFHTTNTLTNGKFDIYLNGVLKGTIDNTESTNWQGWEPISLDLGSANVGMNTVAIRNFRQSDGSSWVGTPSQAGGIYLQGVSQGSMAPDGQTILTGQGSRTAEWLRDNLNTRVTQYAPDGVIIILGANDRGLGVAAATFKSQMQEIINGIKTANSEAKIILMTTPPDSARPTRDHDTITKQYWEAYYDLEKENPDVYLFDCYAAFEGMPTSQWRYDGIHWNKQGNAILFDQLIRRFSDSRYLQIDPNSWNPAYYFTGGNIVERERSLTTRRPQMYLMTNPNTDTPSLSRIDRHPDPDILDLTAYKTTTAAGGSLAYRGYRFYVRGNAPTAGYNYPYHVELCPYGSVGWDYQRMWTYSRGFYGGASRCQYINCLLFSDYGTATGETDLSLNYPGSDMIITVS